MGRISADNNHKLASKLLSKLVGGRELRQKLFLDKGKLSARMGRKAMGRAYRLPGYRKDYEVGILR